MDCHCQKCGEEITLAVSADVKENSRTHIGFKPEQGGVIPAAAIANTILAYQNVMEEMLNASGSPLKTFIERVDTNKNGEMLFTFIYAKPPQKPAHSGEDGGE